MAAALDHVVINTRFDLDAAVEACRRLGFTLTPRGHRSLGSMNHLMVFDSSYLELVGLPPGGEAARPELLAGPAGLDGLVFKAADADAAYRHLRAVGMEGAPPVSFSRPVEIGGEPREARFRTVTARSGALPRGRIYFCEHATPELVWRREWRGHANGAAAIRELVVVSSRPGPETEALARLAGSPAASADGGGRVALGAFTIAVTGAERFAERFAVAPPPAAAAPSRFAAVVLASADMAATRRALSRFSGRVHDGGGELSLRLPGNDAVIAFA